MIKKNENSKSPAKSGSSAAEARIEGLQMPRELMAELANQATEILLDRKASLSDQHAWDGEFRQELEAHFLKPPPEDGTSPVEVLERAAKKILPIAARGDHPRFFGFIPSSPTWPSILADYLTSGFHINQATWLTSSGTSQIELVVIDWICKWIGYPEGAGGLLASGGSAANLMAFVAAREAAGEPEHPTVYMSDQSHSSVSRSARIIGIRKENIRLIPTNRQFQIDTSTLFETIVRDREVGLGPICISANAGTTSTGSVDSLNDIADFCEKHGIWLHVDAAFGGFAAVTERGKKLLSGLERADSICLDPHKWFFQPFETGCLIVKDVTNLENVFSMHHDVLQDTVWGSDHPNFSDRGLQLSRSNRALKIWMSVQIFGMKAFRETILNGMLLGDQAAEEIQNNPNLELISHQSLAIVCFRVNPDNLELSEEVLRNVNHGVLVRIFWEDRAFMSSTTLNGMYSLRMCMINSTTTWSDVSETIDKIEEFGLELIAQERQFGTP